MAVLSLLAQLAFFKSSFPYNNIPSYNSTLCNSKQKYTTYSICILSTSIHSNSACQ